MILKPTIPRKPSSWDLSHAAPWAFDGNTTDADYQAVMDLPTDQQQDALAKLILQKGHTGTLKEPDDLKIAFDHKMAELTECIGNLGETIQFLASHPDASSLLEAAETHLILLDEYRRVTEFISAYQKQFYYNPESQALADQMLKANYVLQKSFGELWKPVQYTEEEFRHLSQEEPKLSGLGRWLLAPPSPRSQPVQLDSKPDPVNMSVLYATVNAEHTSASAARTAAVTHMLNTKFQQVTEYLDKGESVSSTYARSCGLSEKFLAGYIQEIPRLSDAFLNARTSDYQQPPKIPWKKACELMLRAFDDFHPEMGTIARMALADGWLDAKDDFAKTSQASCSFSAGTHRHPNNHPHISLQYNGSLYAFVTLAHEIGHAIASYLATDAQILANGLSILPTGQPLMEVDAGGQHQYVMEHFLPGTANKLSSDMVLHETFARLAESLAVDALMNDAHYAQKSTALKNAHLEYMSNAFTKMITVENALYDEYEQQGGLLTAEQIRDTCNAVMGTDFTTDEVLDKLGNAFHLNTCNPLYTLHYPVAELGAQAILAKRDGLSPQEKQTHAQQWIDVMRSGYQNNFTTAMEAMDVNAHDLPHMLKPMLAAHLTPTPQPARPHPSGRKFQDMLEKGVTNLQGPSLQR